MGKGYFRWNNEENLKLKKERGISFEQVVMHIDQGDLVDIVVHLNFDKYAHQKILVIDINSYVYLVPFVEDENGLFLKTIIPSRKATREYLGRANEQDEI